MRHATSRLGILAITCAATALAGAQPVSTGWTYQGQLKDAGAPADGDYDMIFVLYDAASGGSRVGPPLRFDGGAGNPPPVAVVDGLFTVELDFGQYILALGIRPHVCCKITQDNRQHKQTDAAAQHCRILRMELKKRIPGRLVLDVANGVKLCFLILQQHCENLWNPSLNNLWT